MLAPLTGRGSYRPYQCSPAPLRFSQARALRIAFEQLGHHPVEGRRMIHVDPVRDFVRHRRAADMAGRQQQPPAIPDLARRRAAPPAPARIADRDFGDRHARALGIFRRLLAQQVERRLAEPALDAPLQALARAAAEQPVAGQPRRAPGARRGPDDLHLGIADRDSRARRERPRLGHLRLLRRDPALLLARPIHALLERGAWRQGQLHAAGPRIDREPHPPRPGVADHLDLRWAQSSRSTR